MRASALVEPDPRVGAHEQGRGAARGRPRFAGPVERVVDPRQRAARGVGLDRRELPVGVRAPDGALEVQVREAARQAEQVGQVLVGALFPAARPDELVSGRELAQQLGRGQRKADDEAVDGAQPCLHRTPGRDAVQ